MTRALFVLSGLLGMWFLGAVEGSDELLPLLDRMGEPIFMLKGAKNIVYRIPHDWLSDRYKSLGTGFLAQFGELATGSISVQKINLPDFSIPRSLGKRERFSYFVPEHRRIAAQLIDIFMGMKTVEDFKSAAVYARSNLNPYLFAHAFSVALIHREDTKGLELPSDADVFPGKYFDGWVFSRAREECAVVSNPADRVPIVVPQTANNLEPEHAIAYFREDIGANLHHWHWHLVYPNSGDLSIVKKDRRGELFYYMHEQMLARYDFERFSNGLPRVKKLVIRDPIEEGYFSKLDSSLASRTIPGRPSNTTLSDVNRESEGLQFKLQDLETWADRLFEVARSKAYTSESGKQTRLTTETGIDVLGNMVEASILSPNPKFYGDLHNLGHVAISLAHDPDGRHLESFAVMGDVSTAMRDPVFYRWHKLMDNIFQEYKRGLTPYTDKELDFEGVKIALVEVETIGAEKRDVFETYWQQNDIDLSRGLDFTPRSSVLARTTHINYEHFTFNINVEHTGSGQRDGYVRIFIAPKFDESGATMQFNDQRTLMVELDKFPVTLTQRNNVIQQKSIKSSVTIPYERTFRNLDKGRPSGGEELAKFNFCGCGWPQHLLIPRGTPNGLVAQLFVVVTDYSKDQVEQPSDGQCSDASSYCGVHGQKYPDKRAMGFPFDRPARNGVNHIGNFLTPNMFVKDVIIKFNDRVEPPPYHNATESHLRNPLGLIRSVLFKGLG